MSAAGLCGSALNQRSKYSAVSDRCCGHSKGHVGLCEEFPYLTQLGREAPRVRSKIIRDATMTTGAAWASADAGPNRILRWVMLLSDKELLKFGIKMQDLKPQVVAKLREKAATYESCMDVARKLTFLAYGMTGAPKPTKEIRDYLESFFGSVDEGSTVCHVCRLGIDFRSFDAAKRGKAEIETAHANPRLHTAENVGFAHRECNIAQGAKSLDEFYAWIDGILSRAKTSKSASKRIA